MPLVVDGKFDNYGHFLWPVTGLVISATLFSFSALFIKNKWILYSAVIISATAPYLFIETSGIVVGALLANGFLIFTAAHRVQKESELSLGFSLTKFLKTGLPLYFTIASLIVSVFFLSHLNEEKAIASLLPKPALDTVLKSFSGPLQSLVGLPELNLQGTLEEALLSLAEEQLKSQGIALSQIPKAELNRLIADQRKELEKNLGVKLGNKEKVSDILHKTITNRIEDLLGPYKKYLPYASALTFFFAFKTLTLPLYYGTLLITFLLIKLLLAIKILRSEKQQIEVDRLTL